VAFTASPSPPGSTTLSPVGIWDLSIELIDINNRVRGWFIDGSTLNPGVWTNYSLDPSDPNSPGFIPGPIQDPLFDLTMVAKIRLDEAGMTSAMFIAPLSGGTVFANGQWNAWGNLQVIPEPGTGILIGLGLLALASRKR